MKQLDIALANSIAAVYLIVLSGGALRQEISRLEHEKAVYAKLLRDAGSVLEPLRNFYDGSAVVDGRNLASLLKTFESLAFEIGEAPKTASNLFLQKSDIDFLTDQLSTLRRKHFEIFQNLRQLQKRKQDQTRFEDLTVGEIRDLGSVPRMEVWQASAEMKAIMDALDQLKRAKAPTERKGLEVLLRKNPRPVLLRRSEVPETPSATVTAYLARLSQAGSHSLGALESKVAAIDRTIDEKRKHLDASLKLPFLDQPIDASTLGWVVPVTAAIGVLFCVFYLTRARELYLFSVSLDAEATRAQLMYPWVFLLPPEQDTLSLYIGRILQLALIAAPILASALFLWPAIHSDSAATMAIAIAANVLVVLSAALFAYELACFARASGSGSTRASSQPSSEGQRSELGSP
jgi:hypothetical protein